MRSAYLSVCPAILPPPHGSFFFLSSCAAGHGAPSYRAARNGSLARLRALARGPKRHARSTILFPRQAPGALPTRVYAQHFLSQPDGNFCFAYPSARPKTARPQHDSFSPADPTHSAHLTLCPAVFSPPIGNFFVCLILPRGPKRHARCPRPAARSGTLGRPRALARGSKQHARSVVFFLRLAPRPPPT